MHKSKRIKPANYMNKVHKIARRIHEEEADIHYNEYYDYSRNKNEPTSKIENIKDPAMLHPEIRTAAGMFYIFRNLTIASTFLYVLAETYILFLTKY